MAISRIAKAISLSAPDAADPRQLRSWLDKELLPVIVALRASVNEGATMTADPAIDADVGLLLAVNDAGVVSVQQVTVGAADSGGAGFRLLRIPN